MPSLQVVPLATGVCVHAPVVGSHEAVWHESMGVQVTALPEQVPFWQVSLCVQELPSLQLVPLGALGFEQLPVAGLQVPAAWH